MMIWRGVQVQWWVKRIYWGGWSKWYLWGVGWNDNQIHKLIISIDHKLIVKREDLTQLIVVDINYSGMYFIVFCGTSRHILSGSVFRLFPYANARYWLDAHFTCFSWLLTNALVIQTCVHLAIGIFYEFIWFYKFYWFCFVYFAVILCLSKQIQLIFFTNGR